MKDLTEECAKLELLLDDHVDGSLDPALAARVEEHLAACPRCRAEVDDLRSLLAATAALPRSLDPGHDLWPGIARRLEPRTTAAAGSPSLRPSSGRPRWWLQAVAALLLLAVGGLMGRLLPAAKVVDSAGSPVGEARLAAWDGAGDGFGLAEAEFLRAKESLWLLALKRQDELSPVTRKVVARNLRILDQAIAELRTALEDDPGNQELENLLLDRHRRGVDLLERLARTEV